MSSYIVNGQEFYHHGIKGMKWGRRRYQNSDGSLTPAGIKRYSSATRITRGHAGPGVYIGKKRQLEGAKKDLEFLDKGGHLSVGFTKKRQEMYDKRDRAALEKKIAKLEKREEKKDATSERKGLSDKQKKALKVGAAVAGTALAAYGAYKMSNCLKDKAFRQAYNRGVAANAKYMQDYNRKNVYSLGSDAVAKTKAVMRSNSISTRLHQENMEYAKRASNSTAKAIKTLLGKNYEMPVAELMNAGVDVFLYDRLK